MPPKRDRDFGRKYKSGNEKKKQKATQESQIKALTQSLNKYLVQQHQSSSTSSTSEEYKDAATYENNTKSSIDTSDVGIVDSSKITETRTFANEETEELVNLTNVSDDLSDPATWPEYLNADTRSTIVCKGPKKIEEKDFPADSNRRKLSTTYCKRHMENGEVVNRKWLIYSAAKNKMFCFVANFLATLCLLWDPTGFVTGKMPV